MNLRIVTAGLVAALALSSCGGDDTASGAILPATTQPAPASTAATTSPDETSDEPSAETTGDGTEPVPTISPDLPEAFEGGVGPLAAVGDPLPELPLEGDDPAIGMTAPVLVGETLDGEPIRVDATVDGPTWIVFLAHWCPHCNDEIPRINELRDDGLIPDDLHVVGVSTGASPDRPNWPPDEWLADKDWTFTAMLDGVDTDAGSYIGAAAFGLTAFPFSVLVDGDGVVTNRWSGEREVSDLIALITP